MSPKKNNVLIIDDDIGLMQAMEIVLDSYGIGLSKFTEPIAAIQELKVNKHDVLVVNYLMSMIRGDEIVKLVREFDKEIYIILMSAHKDLAALFHIWRVQLHRGICTKHPHCLGEALFIHLQPLRHPLNTVQLGRSHHLHGSGSLKGAPYRTYPLLYFPQCSHKS